MVATSMQNKMSTGILSTAALAIGAGAIGSLLTLLVTNNLSAPATDDLAAIDAQSGNVRENSLLEQNQGAEANAQAIGIDPADAEGVGGQAVDLQQSLELATAERAQLAKVMAQLTLQVETLEADALNRQSLEVLEEASGAQAEFVTDDSRPAFGDFGERLSPQERIENLVAAGVDPDRAQALQARRDQFQLARLELFDLAEREGWAESEQLSLRLEELEEQRPDLRTELGDQGYDRYLFEAGRSNRVVFDAIIPGSEAEIAGLQAGDMVMSYANQRVFSPNDLQRATRDGVRGEIVPLDIERQGQRLFFEVPRGPLGVSLSGRQRSPS